MALTTVVGWNECSTANRKPSADDRSSADRWIRRLPSHRSGCLRYKRAGGYLRRVVGIGYFVDTPPADTYDFLFAVTSVFSFVTSLEDDLLFWSPPMLETDDLSDEPVLLDDEPEEEEPVEEEPDGEEPVEEELDGEEPVDEDPVDEPFDGELVDEGLWPVDDESWLEDDELPVEPDFISSVRAIGEFWLELEFEPPLFDELELFMIYFLVLRTHSIM